jgi:hypothetical protein
MIQSRFALVVLSAFAWTALSASAAPKFWNGLDPDDVSARASRTFETDVPASAVHDESTHYAPGIDLYAVGATLTDLYGRNGNQLCGPMAITNGMNYLKQSAGFAKLATVGDLDGDGTANSYADQIRYFFAACGTDPNDGTRYQQLEGCMRAYVEASGYNAFVYMIGPHAVHAPAGTSLETMRAALTVDSLRYYVSNRVMLVIGLGWYDYQAATNTYTRTGGHFVDVYGYDYDREWGADRIQLDIVNNWVDYRDRARDQVFDSVRMSRLPDDGTIYPDTTRFELKGTGFEFASRAFVEDIFVVYPY